MATNQQIKEFIDGVWNEYVHNTDIHQIPKSNRLWYDDVKEICRRLISLCTRSHRLAEINCNQGWTDDEEREDSLIDTKAQQTVERLGPGFNLIIQGDPRGAIFKLQVPSNTGYDFGNEGRPVPTTRVNYY
jgi:hypothetical protein